MYKYKQIVYMINDELKNISDDATFTIDHIIFLANRWRATILKQQYLNTNKEISKSNYQTLCIDLEKYKAYDSSCDTLLRSVQEIPNTLIGNVEIYTTDYTQTNIVSVDESRFKYINNSCNKYLGNIIYSSVLKDNHVYLKSTNSDFLHLSKIKVRGVFEDIDEASKYYCNDDSDESNCDILEQNFPLEDGLVTILIESVVKELLGAMYRPADDINDEKDDNADNMSFIRRNMKSAYQEQLEN